MQQTVISTKSLTKEWNTGFKLGPVEIGMKQGETLALLGKNGSGKTTLFQLITGNLDPTIGEVIFLGERLLPDRYDLKRKIGYLPQHLSLPKWVTGKEIIAYGSRLYELQYSKEEIDELLSYWDCLDFINKPLAACSHGMQKRIALTLATIHDPDLLILDEPFSGLDLFHIKALEDLIINRGKSNKVTIICTHIAIYAAKLCETAIVMNEGKLSHLEDWPQSSLLERIDIMEKTFFNN